MKTVNPDLESLEPFEDVLLQFEQAWFEFKQGRVGDSTNGKSEACPSVERFFGNAEGASIELWIELTRIDLEHRLRNHLPVVSDEYQSRLQQPDFAGLRDELLKYEFRLRRKFGQLPDDDELRGRFPQQHSDIAALLDHPELDAMVGTVHIADDESMGDAEVSVVVLVRPGVAINQYRIERQIGSGAFALVYLATDTRLQRLPPIAVSGFNGRSHSQADSSGTARAA